MNDLEELKSLLFGAEKQALDSITERIQKPETRAVDVADVLPEAVRLSHRKGPELVATLRDPVGECVKTSFQREPKEYADALYPVMGPAIRKAIMNALRSFAQQINETVEQSLSARGLKWRFEAWRAGIPFGDYVIQRTLLYRVEQAYLISRDNGLLVAHVHHEASHIKDSDAVSAMFTAIQDFIKESFSPDRTGRLETADMGDFTLWAVHGPHALLVCVIRGVPPRSLRADLSAILERIHFRYGENIREYAGDTSTMQGVEEELVECLNFEARKREESRRRGMSPPLLLALLLLAAALAYAGYASWQLRQQRAALSAAFDATPGLYVSSIERDDGVFVVRGLRDPLAASVADVAAAAGLGADQLVAHLRPYLSLDPQIVRLRSPESGEAPAVDPAIPADDPATPAGAGAAPAAVDAVERAGSAELEQLRADVSGIAERPFLFANGARLTDAADAALREHGAAIRQLSDRAAALGASLTVLVTGHTDATGAVAVNRRLAEQRAEVAAAALLAAGLDPASISRATDVPPSGSGAQDPGLRKATVGLRLELPAETAPPATE